MTTSWSDQDRKDLRRAQEDLESCRVKIKELRAAVNKAVEELGGLLFLLEMENDQDLRDRLGVTRRVIAELEEVKT